MECQEAIKQSCGEELHQIIGAVIGVYILETDPLFSVKTSNNKAPRQDLDPIHDVGPHHIDRQLLEP